MKLTIRRNQADVKGVFGGHKGVSFSLFGQCAVTDAEKALIAKYKVGEYVLAKYTIDTGRNEPLPFTITVDGIIQGKSVETKDIETLLGVEEQMKSGCKNLTTLLTVMATFGGEEVIEI
jgi:hypothetical protein